MKIFSGSVSRGLGLKIAEKLETRLSELEIHVFPDGEKRIRVVDSVLGEECVLVQSTSADPDKNYMELFFIVDALKRSGAKSVVLVIPYLGYQRQDHVFRSGEAVSLEVIIKTLERVGVDKIITFDLHSVKIPELFSIPVVHLSGLPLFAENIKNTPDSVLISPDMGGINRIKQLSSMLGDMKYASIEKNRDLVTGKVEASVIHGNVKKKAFIVDDMISTGSTIVTAANLLLNKGAKEVFVFATHPVLSKNASSLLQKSKVKKVYVTDTINIPEEKIFPKLEILSVANLISKEI